MENYSYRKKNPDEVPKILKMLSRMVYSIIRHSRGTPLHLIIITEKDSKQEVPYAFPLYFIISNSILFVSLDEDCEHPVLRFFSDGGTPSL
jgi:hypothetical protein